MHPQNRKDLTSLYELGKHKQFPEVLRNVLEPRPGLSPEDHEQLDFWNTMGLFPPIKEFGQGNIQLNLCEMVWLRLLAKFRELKITKETVKRFMDLAFLRPDIVSGLNDNPDFRKIFEASLIEGAKADGNTDAETNVKKLIQSPQFLSLMNSLELPSMLVLIIADAILLKNHYSVIVDENGHIFPIKTGYIDLVSGIEELNQYLHSSHSNISLNKVISEFIPEEDDTVNSNRYYSLTDEETQALGLVRSGNARSVEIVMDKDRNIETLIVTESKKVDILSRLSDQITKGGHQEIRIKTQNGNIVHFENKKRIKLNKNGTES